MMAFFNLTLLGPQDPIKSSLRRTAETPKDLRDLRLTTPISTVRDSPGHQSPVAVAQAQTACVTATVPSDLTSTVPPAGRPTANSTIVRTDAPPAYRYLDENQNNGSYARYVDILHKHRRTPQGPNQQYQSSLTSTHEYGRWMVNGNPEKQPWAQHHRHAHINSEMIRFVDEMSLTNKDFSLF